ncbi:MAG: prepilin-type N-terminal cleavage/methylation domain-containing protein [Candidatus Aminicenantes bacterium]|nr:prepilin-type N-terminal cleavage/methylation domain-containing protein [Candidatus Aminicenantes bacterium]
MPKREKGFTIVELLLVLLVVGLLAAMAVNMSLRNRHRWALRGTAREITAMYYQARQAASRESSMVMLDFTADEYVLMVRRNDAWERLKGGTYAEKITVDKIPADSTGFAISPSGILLHPNTLAIYGMQTIRVQAPHPAGQDVITINIYPYGGIRVQTDFR